MKENEKRDITKTIQILKQLDEKSLLLIESGAKILMARQELEQVMKEKAAV